MRYILICFIALFSSYSFANIKITSSYFPDYPAGGVYSSPNAIIDGLKSKQCVLNTNCYGGRCYIKPNDAYVTSHNGVISFFSRLFYFEGCPDATSWGDDGYSYIKYEDAPEENYCDTPQYSIDYANQEKLCLDSAGEHQNAEFTGQCDRENQVLIHQCNITDKPKPPEPEYCPDGSIKPESGICPDIDGGGGDGGGSGGDGGGTNPPKPDGDLSGILAAIKENTAHSDEHFEGNSLYWDKATGTLKDLDLKASKQLANADRRDGLLGDIKNSTANLGDKVDNTNNLLSDIKALTAEAGKIDESINSTAEKIGQKNISELQKIDTELKNSAGKTQEIADNTKAANEKLSQSVEQETLQNSKLDEQTEIMRDNALDLDRTNELLEDISQNNFDSDGIREDLMSIRDLMAKEPSLTDLGVLQCNLDNSCAPMVDDAFPDGMRPIFEDYFQAIKDGELFGFLQDFKFEGNGNARPPQWIFDFTSIEIFGTNLGKWDLSIPPYVWAIVRAFLMFSCVMQCRRIIFGG